MRKIKRYSGKAPDFKQGWEVVDDILYGGVYWRLFMNPYPDKYDEPIYKLAALDKVKRKANYWLIPGKDDWHLLKEYRKGLYNSCMAIINT